jgi:microsomal dipeptidase-like Zn-dependent dipeptidase
MEEVKTLIEKKKNGEDLTDEEIEKLKELNWKRWFGFHRGGE